MGHFLTFLATNNDISPTFFAHFYHEKHVYALSALFFVKDPEIYQCFCNGRVRILMYSITLFASRTEDIPYSNTRIYGKEKHAGGELSWGQNSTSNKILFLLMA